ncbi:uncharacterized protein si:ch211-227n13.3 isoform X2 [Kryptolebias marmoratus]|nr:uncharacterized protein si:ch211-227n13.3 isoform X2 [Kryptolebias marmoratus]
MSIKIEFYRCFEYKLKWNRPMSPQRSFRLSKKSVQKSPMPNQDVSPDKPRSRTERTRLQNASDCEVDKDDRKDLIDLISSTEGGAVEVVDYGLDESDEDRASDCSSVASGPSVLRHTTSKRPKSSQALCPACRELYQRAKRTKEPIKNKLLENDPKSLACDQWVLIKRFRSRKLPTARLKSLSDVQLGKGATLTPGESPVCSRLHIFLQRNLRRVRQPARKERRRRRNRMKRRRDGSQGCRVAKQQRLQSNSRHVEENSDSCFSSCAGPGRRSDPKTDKRADPELTVVSTPSSAAPKPSKPAEVGSGQKTQRKTRSFRELLAQLRGSSSMIVREKR